MKKSGFTLAEALISLAIIGVVAALTLPAINRLRPDEIKMKYLQAYDSLSKAIPTAIDTFYAEGKFDTNVRKTDGPGYVQKSVKYFPLFDNTQQVAGCTPDDWDPGVRGDYTNKLCPALACTFNVTDIQNICSRDENGQISTDATNISQADFTTQNGFSWQIGPAPEDEVSSDEPYQMDGDVEARYLQVVLVDVDPERSSNCTYNSGTCEHPTIFKFFVTADGNVIIGDAMGLMYNLTRKSLTRNDSITPQTEITVGTDNDGNSVTVTPTTKISQVMQSLSNNNYAYIENITQPNGGNSANGQCPAGGTQSDETDGDAD